MEGFDVEKEIKAAGEKLNTDTIKLMTKCVEELTTSGSPSLDAAVMKKFKRYCRESDDYVRFAFLLIMRQLKKKHSEIRLSAFQMADELFNRSHAFREILVTHLQPFLNLTTAMETKNPLPPPKSAADKLKKDTLHAFQQWYDKYSMGYRKLAVGYDYLKNCKHVDFNDIRAQNEAERRRIELEEKRKQKIMADRLAKVLKDISETKPEIDNCAREAESCLQLLLPTPTDFLLSLSDEGARSSTADDDAAKGLIKYVANCNSNNEDLPTQESFKGISSAEEKDHEKISLCTAVRHEQDTKCTSVEISSSEKVTHPAITTDSLCSGSDCSMDKTHHSTEADKASKIDHDAPNCESTKAQENISQHSLEEDAFEKLKDSDTPGKRNDESSIDVASQNDDESELENESDDTDVYESDEDMQENLQAHGLTRPTHSLTLEIPMPGPVAVQVTSDNRDVARTLKDANKLISSTYLPKVTKWLEILGKNGAKQGDITAAIDLKVHLESIKEKCVELKLVSEEEEKKVMQDDSDDDDFEEVPEKEGYEPRIPNHLRAEYGLAGPSSMGKRESTSKGKPEAKPVPLKKESSSSSSTGSVNLRTQGRSSSGSSQWNLKERIKMEDVADPTSLAAALVRVRSQSSDGDLEKANASKSPSASTSGDTEKEKDTAVPMIEFGTDLAYWENPDQMEAPTIVKYDSLHRFWAPKEAETEKPSQHDLAAVRNRVFTYTGKFEPVKWKCRAPMPNGKLCERMDRVKCPFHGKIIPRDEQGRPSGDEQPSTSGDVKVQVEETSETTQESGMMSDTFTAFVVIRELPPWQDPELQRDIELATGHDLGSARSQKLLDKAAKGKGKGKGKGKKYPNLTDINTITNTSRRRLENKVFKKSAVKRVCAVLDRADYKRVRDKFGNQFNYSLH